MKTSILFFGLLIAMPITNLLGQDLPLRVSDLEKKVAALEKTVQKLSVLVEENAVPVGTIAAFGGPESQLPDGWLHCNGRGYDVSQYPKLAEALSRSWGGNSAGTRFNVPDLRGRFLRGWDETADIDPDKLARTSNNGSKSGNNVGSYQGDATALPNNNFSGITNTAGEHTHPIPASHITPTGRVDWKLDDTTATGEKRDYSTSAAGNHSHTLTVTSGGDAETRPANAYAIFIIKAE